MRTITHLLVDAVTILRLANTKVAAGRYLRDYTTLATEVPFRLFGVPGMEQTSAMQKKTYADASGYCQPTQDIAVDDVVVKDGVHYRVVSLEPPSEPRFKKVTLQRIQFGGAA
jgi:hypothetical protein